jgi:hypothetical protein
MISISAPTVQVCAFAAGCAAIHAARAHAAAVTYLLVAAAAVVATALSFVVALNIAPDHEPPFDEMMLFAELASKRVAVRAETEARP